ncbi:cysteine proteinase inhibitor A-like [Chenopodium quinoa]|uniref:Cysteine proteinase inhibitor n=1 Tax=Chenopodium quinoa TaxID=63459 RepID=A0A803LIC3_CHEQI|nr:cysteine proteinase inhibitor A-like [Chenopodium quinoa]
MRRRSICSAQPTKNLGGLQPVEPTNPKIQEIAAWAVEEHNKEQGTCLEYEKVLKAEQQVVAGMMYYIELEAANGCLMNKYFAKVFDQSWTQTRKLEEFKCMRQDNERIAIAN